MKNIINTLEELIKIPSVSSDFEQSEIIIKYINDYFSGYKNAFISIHRFNKYPSIVIGNFDGKKSDIILNGHVDIVPPSEENQFIPVHKEGKIIARGSGDMKAGIAIMMQLMKDIFESNFTDKKVLLIINTDEEIGGENGAERLVELGYSASGVLVPDSGDSDTIVIAEKGIYDLEIEVSGKSCHASRPWLGDNAIEKTYEIYKALRALIQNDTALQANNHWGSSVNLTKVEAGTATNVIPDRCKAFFDIRVTEEIGDMEVLQKKIEKLVLEYNATILTLFKGDLVFTDPSHEFIQSYLSSYKKITGKNATIAKEHGASDGRFFASKNMPLLLQRPTCKNIHSKNEWVDISSMELIYNVYKDFIFENTFGQK